MVCLVMHSIKMFQPKKPLKPHPAWPGGVQGSGGGQVKPKRYHPTTHLKGSTAPGHPFSPQPPQASAHKVFSTLLASSSLQNPDLQILQTSPDSIDGKILQNKAFYTFYQNSLYIFSLSLDTFMGRSYKFLRNYLLI